MTLYSKFSEYHALVPTVTLFHRTIEGLDGLVTSTSPLIEPQLVEALTKHLKPRGADVFAVGPLAPQGVESGTMMKGEFSQSPSSDEAAAFLDNAMQMRGEKTVLYVCAYYPRAASQF